MKNKKNWLFGGLIIGAIVLLSILVIWVFGDSGENGPTSDITRKEWSKKLAQRFGHVNSQVTEPYFADLTSESEYFVYVQSLAEQGVILTEGSFQPNKVMTGNEMLVEVGRAFGERYISKRLGKDELTDADYIAYLTETVSELEPYAVDKGLLVNEAEALLDQAYFAYLDLEYENKAELDVKDEVLILTENPYTVDGETYQVTSDKEIKVGDIILLAATEADPDGAAIKVEQVQVNGNVYAISGSEPSLEEVFDEFELEFSQIAASEEFTPAEGIEIAGIDEDGSMHLTFVPVASYDKNIGYAKEEVLSAYFEWGDESSLEYSKEYLEYADSVVVATGEQPSYLVSKEKPVAKYTGGYNFKVGLKVSKLLVTGSAQYTFPNKLGFNVNTAVTIEPEVELSGNADVKYKLGTYTITIPQAAGAVQLKVDLYCQIGINGDIKVSTEIRAASSVSKAVGSSAISASTKVDSHVEFEADCEVEVLVGPDVTLKLFGIQIVDAYVFMGAGGCTQYTLEKPDIMQFSVYLPVIKAGVGLNDETALSKLFEIEKEINIMDREEDDPLVKSLYRKDFDVKLYDVADLKPNVTQGVTYKIENGVLTFSGQGEIKGIDGDDGLPPWMEYREEITKVVIEEGITTIGVYALSHLENVKEVVIADSVTYIAEGAFYENYGMETVKFPAGLEEIGVLAFHCCESLKSIELPEGLTKISDSAFSFCAALESVTLPSTIAEIDVHAFEYCESLTSINVPDGAVVAEDAFDGCTALGK